MQYPLTNIKTVDSKFLVSQCCDNNMYIIVYGWDAAPHPTRPPLAHYVSIRRDGKLVSDYKYKSNVFVKKLTEEAISSAFYYERTCRAFKVLKIILQPQPKVKLNKSLQEVARFHK